MDKGEYLSKLQDFNSSIRFIEGEGVLEVISENLENKDFSALYEGAIEFLEDNVAPPGVFQYPKVVDIELGYYSGCLLRYAAELLDEGMSHSSTCWGAICERTIEMGYMDDPDMSSEDFIIGKAEDGDITAKKLLGALKKGGIGPENFQVVENWVKYTGPNINELNWNGPYYRFKKRIRSIVKGDNDRVIKLIENIKKDGWQPNLAYGGKTGVLGLSSVDGKYMVFHGKHRLVALKYLIFKKLVSESTVLEYPVIRFNFPCWRQNVAPFKEKVCEGCGCLS